MAWVNKVNLELVKKHSLLKLVSKRTFPFILVLPQCPKDRTWDTEILLALIDSIEERYLVDPGLCDGIEYGRVWDLALDRQGTRSFCRGNADLQQRWEFYQVCDWFTS
ncbi:MAG: hypothetical protein M2R45_01315 [Verrucomicrobia subdivision 3 bacterium]|nr:hypothetical protein [Limisphaerales bacterium]MCS1415181.1 hypothetical protein [Limisphaerales bacterium]